MYSDNTDVSIAYVGLGANLGDAVGQIVDVKAKLRELTNVKSFRSSSLYVTSPVGYADQADFINCAVELTVDCGYRTLFSMLQDIELEMGRTRDPSNRNAARLIDIDLLFFGDIRCDEDDLKIPHPRVSERLFVLLPLSELNHELFEKYMVFDESAYLDQRIEKLAL